jgi:hypothetical protein
MKTSFIDFIKAPPKQQATDARISYWEKLKNGFEVNCPCCGRYSKVYKRQIHKTLAIVMLKMARAEKDEEGFVDMPNLLQDFRAGRDFCILKYWLLIEEKPRENTKTRTSGKWKLTQFGYNFIKGNAAVAKQAYVFDDEVFRYSDEQAVIGEIVGVNFDYQTLMES